MVVAFKKYGFGFELVFFFLLVFKKKMLQ